MDSEKRQIFKIDTGVRHKVEPGQGFPPLMPDTRENNLANFELNDKERVYVKAIAGPYVGADGLHMMVLPDLASEENILDVGDISRDHLFKVLQIAGSLGDHAFEEEGIDEVNIGIHTAKDEWVKGVPKQRTKNFPNLHVHVEAAVYENKPEITSQELKTNPEYKGKTPDPFERIGYEILLNEIFPELRSQAVAVDELFSETKDKGGRLRLSLKNGKETFNEPRLAAFLQALDVKGQKVYDEVAGCFFETEENGKFKVDEGKYQRYKLLPKEERQQRIEDYIQKRDWLSKGSKAGLRMFASRVMEAEKVVDLQMEKAVEASPNINQIANRFMGYRGFSYATLFSGTKNEQGNVEWTLGIRPNVFLVEGFVEMAPTYGIIVKHADMPFTEEELNEVQNKEKNVIEKAQKDVPGLKNGPGLTKGI